MNFEKAKELMKEAIDEGNNLAEIMEIFTQKVYEQGKHNPDHFVGEPYRRFRPAPCFRKGHRNRDPRGGS